MRDDNLTLVKRGYEAFNKGDLGAVREMMAPDCVWRTPGHGPFRAEYTGPDGVIEYFTSLAELSEGTFKSEPEAFFADDERTVVLVRNTGARKRRVMDTCLIHVFRVRDGKFSEVTTFASEPRRNEEFWS